MEIRMELLTTPDDSMVREITELERLAFDRGGLINGWLLVPFIRYGRVYLLKADEQVVGVCQLMRDWQEGHLVYLYGISIHPGWRKQGLGRRFVTGILEELRHEGWAQVRLSVSPNNLPAVRLYQDRLGFHRVELVRDEYGLGEDRLVMELDLQQ